MTPLEKKGFAVGHSDIRSGYIVFRFKNEVFEIDLLDAQRHYNGYFYSCPVKELRRMVKADKKEKKHG